MLQEWLSSLPNIPYSQGEGKWGMFVLVSSTHKQLAINIDSLKSEDGNLEDFVKILNSSRTKDWSHTDWLKESNHMAEYKNLFCYWLFYGSWIKVFLNVSFHS